VDASQSERVAGGLVVASHQAAADAGAVALAKGGTAVDAAVATALALSVVDPASCGIGGYGGFLVYSQPGSEPVQIDVNTWPPRRLDPSLLRIPGNPAQPLDGGIAVAPPAVVPGLHAAHARFGTVPWHDLVMPAVRLARHGFAIGRDLTRAFSDHWNRTGGGHPSFASIFFPEGRPPKRGTWLMQPELAQTLESIGRDGAAAFNDGPFVEATCAVVAGDGGMLEREDFRDGMSVVTPAISERFESATVYGPSPTTSGAGVLFGALRRLDTNQLGAGRDEAYVAELVRALGLAWRERAHEARAALTAQHTTHLCAADAAGGLASLTFTHGHRRFGSGLVAPGTGVVLNSGINLFSPTPEGPRAVTNMTPVIVHDDFGHRHAVGSVGGPRIPGILLSAVVDLVHYRTTISEAIAAPHLGARASDGALEGEPELLAALNVAEEAVPLVAGVAFGTTCGITRTADRALPGPDYRFECGVAWT
jgi:gamma-glutamyltranspeptidase / glutathione hydrolase